MTNEVRIDKWLWAVRVYKTRSLAIDACRAGHVRIGGRVVKPSRSVRLGDQVTARVGRLTRTVRVRGFLDRRVGAAAVGEYLEELIPLAEKPSPRQPSHQPLFSWARGGGRPTKRDRRLFEKLVGQQGQTKE